MARSSAAGIAPGSATEYSVCYVGILCYSSIVGVMLVEKAMMSPSVYSQSILNAVQLGFDGFQLLVSVICLHF
jgi:hypothetical protein